MGGLALEVVIGDGLNVDLGGIDLGGGGDAHLLVDALERDTVDLAGAGDLGFNQDIIIAKLKMKNFMHGICFEVNSNLERG